MPLKPDWSKHEPDPRLDQYRGRVARLFRGEQPVGLLLVRVAAYAAVASGRLWWRRWSDPVDMLELWFVVDGGFGDAVVTAAAEIDEDLRDFAAGRFALRGEVLRLEWTPPDESAQLRRSEFGSH